jgi:sugar lactone lactonase YvrE
MFKGVGQRLVAAVLVVIGTLACSATAVAYSPSPGVVAEPFATGFSPARGGEGPVGVAFDGVGNLFVTAGRDLYRFGPAGGRADRAHRVNAAPMSGILAGLAFGQSGGLYAARWTAARTGDVVQLDPATGRVLRQVVSGLACPTGLAVDPLSGDLFVSSVWCVPQVLRISGGRATPYMTGVHTDGVTFGPDGTLYAAHQPDASGFTVSAVARDGARTGLARVPQADGLALGRAAAPQGGPGFLVVNRRDQRISNVDLATGSRPVRDLVTGATRGDFVAVGPDGCLYATQSTEVVRLRGADGGCTATGTALEPSGVRIAPPAGSFVQVTGGSAKAATCRTNRRLKVRFRAPGGIRVRTARIFVKGKFNRRVSGRALRRSVVVKKLPAKRFTLTIRAKTRTGRRIVVRRKYGACAGR